MTAARYPQTPLTRVRRIAERASYDHQAVHDALDAAYVCHVAFSVDGQPHCIPTAHWRDGHTLYIHGSNGSRLLRALGEGAPACVTVTTVDGLVLARSAFHHSMNYRSAMVYGNFRVVEDRDEKWSAMQSFMERLAPGRWDEVRQPNDNEFNATTVLALDMEQAVAKSRSGPPKDDPEDHAIDVWAGVWPLRQGHDAPQPDAELRDDIPLPAYLK